MVKVITYGTFDTFHYGHFFLLERAASLGDHLTVGVSTDKFNNTKQKQALLDWQTRSHIVRNISCVDNVIPEKTWDQKINDIVENEIDIFVIGDDWKGEFDFLKAFCEVLYLPRTEKISSTLIRSAQ